MMHGDHDDNKWVLACGHPPGFKGDCPCSKIGLVYRAPVHGRVFTWRVVLPKETPDA